ncbi:hypothetical protein CCHR01_03426 [Colletotrichum chrysophilum]|uniref:Uncharacterized protein n=1 Tax=Colletotrichum chrysophilum TaxID=1836956 RepID=A0AAD9ATS8_9PEZI|nr:hypothetical protein CCHR01_03426 [Colletotrichum chrysophilum]
MLLTAYPSIVKELLNAVSSIQTVSPWKEEASRRRQLDANARYLLCQPASQPAHHNTAFAAAQPRTLCCCCSQVMYRTISSPHAFFTQLGELSPPNPPGASTQSAYPA